MHRKEITVIGENGLPITSKIANYLKNLCPIAPHIVWRSDFTHIILRGTHLYLATILDDYTKEIVGYALSFVHTKEFVLMAIEDAIKRTGGILPHIFHSDQ
jgi:putative transposase